MHGFPYTARGLRAALLLLALVVPIAAQAGSSAAPGGPRHSPVVQTVVTLPPNTDRVLGTAAGRTYLVIVNIGTGLATLGFDQVAVAGQGFPLSAAPSNGDLGGSVTFEGGLIPTSTVHANSAIGTTLVVLEGH